MIKQKAKFKGKPNQIFNIEQDSFASGIWKFITPAQVTNLANSGAYIHFEFDPPVNFGEIIKTTESFQSEVKEKPRKKSRKRRKKEVEE